MFVCFLFPFCPLVIMFKFTSFVCHQDINFAFYCFCYGGFSRPSGYIVTTLSRALWQIITTLSRALWQIITTPGRALWQIITTPGRALWQSFICFLLSSISNVCPVMQKVSSYYSFSSKLQMVDSLSVVTKNCFRKVVCQEYLHYIHQISHRNYTVLKSILCFDH